MYAQIKYAEAAVFQWPGLTAGNMLFAPTTIILFCIVVLIPFFQGIPYSFTNWKSIVSETKEFNGLKNYIYPIKNKYFQDSLLVTFKFTILYMIPANVMGLFAGAGHPQVFLVQ